MQNGNGVGLSIPPDVVRIRQYLADANQPLYERCATDGEAPLASLRKREDADATLACRATAARALHLIWLQWLESVAQTCDRRLSYYIELLALQLLRERWIKAGAPVDFERALLDFFDRAGRAIFESSDPVAAMSVFWDGPTRHRKPGRPREDYLTDRDLRIACEVAVDIAARRGNYEAAVRSVAARANLSKKSVENAYRRHKDDLIVQASVELSRIKKTET